MNEYMRWRASNLHPNPAVHALWWRQALAKHRHDIRKLDSPIKKYINQPVLDVPKRHASSHLISGSRPSSAGRRRPQSASGSRPSSAGASGRRPQSSSGIRRPPQPPAGQKNQWDPFNGLVEGGNPAASASRIHPNRGPPVTASAFVTMRRIGDTFTAAADDIDNIDEIIKNSGSLDLKMQFASLKLQISEVQKKMEGICESMKVEGF